MESCLSKLLKEMGWSHGEFAKLLGVSQPQVSTWISKRKFSRAAEAGFRTMLACVEAGRPDLVLSGMPNACSEIASLDRPRIQVLSDLADAAANLADTINPDDQVSPELYREATDHLKRAKVILRLYGFASPKPKPAADTT